LNEPTQQLRGANTDELSGGGVGYGASAELRLKIVPPCAPIAARCISPPNLSARRPGSLSAI